MGLVASPFGTQAVSPFGTQAASPFGTQAASPFDTQGASSFGTQAASPFATQAASPFGRSTPALGTSSSPAFGTTSPSPFGGSSVSERTPASEHSGFTAPSRHFGNPSQEPQRPMGLFCKPPLEASSRLPFGVPSTPAFGVPSTPAFGVPSTPAFGVPSTPAFGTLRTPDYRSTPTPFGVASIPASPFCSTPSWPQSSPFSEEARATKAGFWNHGSPKVPAGSRWCCYDQTREENSGTGTLPPTGKLESISAMPEYKGKAHEELRWEDYQSGDKGDASFVSRDPKPSSASLFGVPSTVGTPGFASSTHTFNSSPFGHPIAPAQSQTTSGFFSRPGYYATPSQSSFGKPDTSNPIGPAQAHTPSVFNTASSFPPGSSLFSTPASNPFVSAQAQTPSNRPTSRPSFGTRYTSAFGTPSSTSATTQAQGTTSSSTNGINPGTQSANLFQSSSPAPGQTSSPFGQPPFGKPDTSPFGKPDTSNPIRPAQAHTPSFPPGSSLFGTPASNPLVPAQAQTPSVFNTPSNRFGTPTSPSPFGTPNTSAFGTPSSTSATTQAQGTTSSSTNGINPGTQSANLFQSSSPAPGQTSSPFGQPPFAQAAPYHVYVAHTDSSAFGSTTMPGPFEYSFQQSQPGFSLCMNFPSSVCGSTHIEVSSQPASSNTTSAFGQSVAVTVNPFSDTTPKSADFTFPPVSICISVSPYSSSTSTNQFDPKKSSVFTSFQSAPSGFCPNHGFRQPTLGSQCVNVTSGSTCTQKPVDSWSQSTLANQIAAMKITSYNPVQSTQSGLCPNHGSPFACQCSASKAAPYAQTPKADDGRGTESAGKLLSISAMPAYKEKNHEELRCEDYHFGDIGGPKVSNMQSASFMFGTPNPQTPQANTFSGTKPAGNQLGARGVRNCDGQSSGEMASNTNNTKSTHFTFAPAFNQIHANPFTSSTSTSVLPKRSSIFSNITQSTPPEPITDYVHPIPSEPRSDYVHPSLTAGGTWQPGGIFGTYSNNDQSNIFSNPPESSQLPVTRPGWGKYPASW